MNKTALTLCRLILFGFALIIAAPMSAAQPAAQRGRGSAPADALIGQATVAMGTKDFAAAQRFLTLAFQITPGGVVLYHFGVLAAAQGHAVEARDLWRRFLLDASVDANHPLRAEAQRQLEKLPEADAGEVSIGAPRGTQVQIDGHLCGALPLAAPLLVQTGPHRITVSQGRWRAETEVQVRTARLAEVRFKVGSDVAVVSFPAAALYLDEIDGFDAAASERLNQVVEAAVKRENLVVLPRATALAYAHDGACVNLADTACQQALAQRYGADHVLIVRAKRGEGSWQLEVSLHDVAVDDIAASASNPCPACTSDQITARLGESITQVFEKGSGRARGNLDISTTPPGAEVMLNGRRAGITPYKHPMWAGTYALELRSPNRQPYQQSVEVRPDAPTHIEADLTPEQAVAVVKTAVTPTKSKPRMIANRPSWRFAAGLAAIGVSAIVIGFGAAAVAVNGDCAVDNLPDGATCQRAYQTTGVGSALIAAGGALALTGIVVIAVPPWK